MNIRKFLHGSPAKNFFKKAFFTTLFCLLVPVISTPTFGYSREYYGEKNIPVIEPALQYSKEGMRAFQTHYTNYVFYTQNLFTPGHVEIGCYNQNIDNRIETVPFYRWRMGPVKETENELDFFIESQQRGFFTIRLPFGLGYTRDGRIKRDENGRLVTFAGGFPVLGQSGDIYIPEGFISVTPSGAIFVDGDLIDKFKISVFKDRERLVTLNGGVFYVNGKPELLDGERFFKIRQGFLEESNVLKALTGDIGVASKSYQGSAKSAKVVLKIMGSGIQLASPN